MIILLSHPLNQSAPLYPGTPPVAITRTRSMSAGHSANTSMIACSSHAGTHIDLPRHFCQQGGSVSELLAPETVFAPTRCIVLPIDGNLPITPDLIRPNINGIRDAAALLIRTGYFQVRATAPGIYASDHPWVHPDLPAFLREECPHLRIFGIDTISISIPSHREEGRTAHRNFLCGSPPILLLEDLNLSSDELLNGSFTLRLYPFIYDDLDGVPVVALAER